MSYTYSRTFLRQNDPRIARPINGGEWYPTEYDKPHDFKLVGNYKFTRRYSMSFNMGLQYGPSHHNSCRAILRPGFEENAGLLYRP